MQDTVKEIEVQALAQLAEVEEISQLDALRVQVLGKKGSLTALLRNMGSLSAEERPVFGALVNACRARIEEDMDEKEKSIKQKDLSQKLSDEAIDVTWPLDQSRYGGIHPMHLVQQQVERIFLGMGFTVAEGPEVELDTYNFELLNIPANHPARDMQDSFYFSEHVLLRTQTSAVQARYMQKHQPPIRIICPGRVYRADEVDSSHSPVFHQMEGLVVDKGITMAHLRGALDAFAKELYGQRARIRFRPSYFPFTEPSAEVDISCTLCDGKGCKTCKGAGWLEVLGAGMVHPKVLAGCGIDPNEYTGFAFGIGLERITMLKYGISDLRLLFENDMRFLSQFSK